MRYLDFHPMYHVNRKDTVDRMNSVIEDFRRRGLITEEERGLLNLDFKDFEGYWDETREMIAERIEENGSYDKLYLESVTEGSGEDIEGDSSMVKCVRSVLDSGARLEVTESYFWREMVEIVSKGWMGEYCHKKREKSTIRSIDHSLRNGERGILLFGKGHEEGLLKRLKKTDIKVHII